MRATATRLPVSFAALAVLFAATTAAQTTALSDFQHICLDTYADSAPALAVADAAGWVKDASRADDYKSLGGSDGRILAPGAANFGIFAVGETSSPYETKSVKGVATILECVLLAVGPFDHNAPELKKLVPLKIGKQTTEYLQWRYAVVGDTYLSIDHGSVEDAVKAAEAKKGSLLLTVLKFDGGIIFSLGTRHSEATRKSGKK